MAQEKDIQVRSTIGADLKAATDRIKDAMATITENTVDILGSQYEGVLQTITPYDTDDAMKLLAKPLQSWPRSCLRQYETRVSTRCCWDALTTHI